MIYQEKPNDSYTVAQLAIKLFKDNDIDSLKKEFIDIINNENNRVFIYILDNKPIGFAQCGLRYDYVEGTQSSPVGYLEGIFVEETFRNRGCARELLAACQAWAKEKGCSEFASDCELDNRASLSFHLSMGFEEANRIICFTKKL